MTPSPRSTPTTADRRTLRRLARRFGAILLAATVVATLAPVATSAAAPIRPSPTRAYADLPALHATGCVLPRASRGFKACRFGHERGRKTVVLVGDSKAAQWFTPINRIAKAQRWRLVVIVKNGCTFGNVTRLNESGKPDRICRAWAAQALRTIKRMRPDVVIPVTRWDSSLPRGATGGRYTQAAMVRGLVPYWRQLIQVGARVTPILDTPGPPSGDAPACVRENRNRLARCAYPKAPAVRLSGAGAARKAAQRVPKVRTINLTPKMCRASRCPAVIGRTLVYRGGSHVSNTFATSLARPISRALHRATKGELGRR